MYALFRKERRERGYRTPRTTPRVQYSELPPSRLTNRPRPFRGLSGRGEHQQHPSVAGSQKKTERIHPYLALTHKGDWSNEARFAFRTLRFNQSRAPGSIKGQPSMRNAPITTKSPFIARSLISRTIGPPVREAQDFRSSFSSIG